MADAFRFSKREKELVNLLLEGKSNKQIARLLGISVSTVEFHLKNIYAKLHVNSRAEAISKLMGLRKGVIALLLNSLGEVFARLMNSAGKAFSKLGKSTVDPDGQKAHNKDSFREVVVFFRKHFFWIASGILLIILLVIFLPALVFPRPWEKYERECEYPDAATVGQMIERSNASNLKVHGQFGTTSASPYPEQPGYVVYENMNLPGINQLYLKLRYSKDTSSSVPILVYIDDEPAPRASIYPLDQHSWNQFAWTDAIFLGSIQRGVHSIRLTTAGQQYGVADLDKLILSSKTDSPF